MAVAPLSSVGSIDGGGLECGAMQSSCAAHHGRRPMSSAPPLCRGTSPRTRGRREDAGRQRHLAEARESVGPWRYGMVARARLHLCASSRSCSVAYTTKTFDDVMARYHLPGLALGVIEDGKVTYTRTSGELVAGSGQESHARYAVQDRFEQQGDDDRRCSRAWSRPAS